MVQTMLKLVTSHEPIFRVASKTESMGHISVPPLYSDKLLRLLELSKLSKQVFRAALRAPCTPCLQALWSPSDSYSTVSSRQNRAALQV